MARLGVATEKVPGGKLLRVKAWVSEDGSVIEKTQVTGDFFAHPEDCVLEIEKALSGAKASLDEKALGERVGRVVEARKAVLVGVDPTAIARVLKAAASNAK
ncbi:MAG TPA: biotin--protein ligase [archaeon]|nr:biotin--protein ligase [archaeon]HLD80596.1 biotin--protein ligase [archaeon]